MTPEELREHERTLKLEKITELWNNVNDKRMDEIVILLTEVGSFSYEQSIQQE